MKKRPGPILAACLAVGVLASAIAVGLRQRGLAARSLRGAAEVEARLERRLPEWTVLHAPLRQVIDDLGTRAGVKIVVRWDRLGADGIDPEAPVDFDLRDVSPAVALDLLLGEFPRPEMAAWSAAGEGVIISSAADLESEAVVRVYDVRDLVETTVRPEDVSSGTWWCATGPPPPKPTAPPTFAQIKQVQDDRALEVHYFVEDSARRHASPDLITEVTTWSGRVVMTAPPAFHREYERALLDLRRRVAGPNGRPR